MGFCFSVKGMHGHEKAQILLEAARNAHTFVGLEADTRG